MTRPQRVLTVLAACAALMCGARMVPATAGSRRHEYQAAHYDIETDINPAFARVVGAHMEEIFQTFSSLFDPSKHKEYSEIKDRFKVVVFARQADYAREVPASVRGSIGVFIAGRDLLAASAEGRTPENVLRTLYHEGFHQFMFNAVSPACPIWLNEGLAEYFSEATWNGAEFQLGQVPTRRAFVVQEAIRDGSYIRLQDLFAMSNEAWGRSARTDGRRADLQYNQAWSVAHFLLHAAGGRHRSKVDGFLRAVADRADPWNWDDAVQEAFTESFGANVQAFEQEWMRHVMSLQPSPKFRCRDNLEALMLLGTLVHDHPRDFDSMKKLRKRVVDSRRYGWKITRPTGEVVTSDQKDKVALMFRCPFDKRGPDISYVRVMNVTLGLPVLVCVHHPGIIIKAYYEPQGGGQYKIIVEEEVRETLPADFSRAIQNAIARRD